MLESVNGVAREDFSWNSNRSRGDLKAKKVAIVGGTNGIGRALATKFLGSGSEVTVIGRTFHDKHLPNLEFVRCDLSSLKEAKKMAQELPAEELDYLILTTGIFAAKERAETSEGIEEDLAVSYLSRLVIIREVAEKLGTTRPNQSEKARVFVWGFPGTSQAADMEDLNSENSYEFMVAHTRTMIGNESIVHEYAKRYPNINIYGMNPGLVRSDIRANVTGSGLLNKLSESLIGVIFGGTEKYAKRVMPLITSVEIEDCSGYLFNKRPTAIKPSTFNDDDYNEKVVRDSEQIADRALS